MLKFAITNPKITSYIPNRWRRKEMKWLVTVIGNTDPEGFKNLQTAFLLECLKRHEDLMKKMQEIDPEILIALEDAKDVSCKFKFVLEI